MQCRSCFKSPFHAALVVAYCVTSVCLLARAAENQAPDASKSWTATNEPQVSVNVNPTRMTETHTLFGNRIVDTQSVERLIAGRFEPYFDVEKESIHVSDTTIRTVVRIFDRDGARRRTLGKVTEEVRESLPGGSESVVRTVSTPDMDGHLQIRQREVTNIQNTGPDDQETRTSIFSSDGSGGLAPVTQIQERQRRTDDHTVEVQKTTLLLDGGGHWQLHELRENTIMENGNDRTIEERVSAHEYDGGKLSVVSHTITKESEADHGERHASVETYSTNIPGWTPDGKLHLSQRVTTVRRPHSDGGQATEEQVEQPNPGDHPGAPLKVTSKTIEIVRTDYSGTLKTRTIQAQDGSGKLRVIWAGTQKSNATSAVQVETTTPEKPK